MTLRPPWPAIARLVSLRAACIGRGRGHGPGPGSAAHWLELPPGVHTGPPLRGRGMRRFATLMRRFWRSCGGVCSFVRDTGRGLRCRRALSRWIKLAHFGPESVRSQPRASDRPVKGYISLFTDPTVWVQPGVVSITRGSRNVRQDCSTRATLIQESHSLNTCRCA